MNLRLQRMKEINMTLPMGSIGNDAVKFLATLNRIDPHDLQAVANMILGLVQRETDGILKRLEPEGEANK